MNGYLKRELLGDNDGRIGSVKNMALFKNQKSGTNGYFIVLPQLCRCKQWDSSNTLQSSSCCRSSDTVWMDQLEQEKNQSNTERFQTGPVSDNICIKTTLTLCAEGLVPHSVHSDDFLMACKTSRSHYKGPEAHWPSDHSSARLIKCCEVTDGVLESCKVSGE